jgi:hypothetical protein
MKSIAKFELCRELYELSGWVWTDFYYKILEDQPQVVDIVLGRRPFRNLGSGVGCS